MVTKTFCSAAPKSGAFCLTVMTACALVSVRVDVLADEKQSLSRRRYKVND